MALPVAETAWPYAVPDTRVLVVIPTYNEIENIDEVLRRTRRALPDATVLVVDDNSPDGTAEIADRVGAELGRITVLRRPVKEGLGVAYRAGMSEGLAQGNAYVFRGVVKINVGIALGAHLDINQGVARQQLQHVIEKAHAGLHVEGSGAIQINGNGDLGFRRFAV